MPSSRKPPNRRNTAKAQIEATPKIGKLEMAWVKKYGELGVLEPAALRREKKKVYPKHSLLGNRSHTHSHLSSILSRKNVPIPGRLDLFTFLSRSQTGFHTMHIATINRQGEVIGYTSIRATKKLYDSVSNQSAFSYQTKRVTETPRKMYKLLLYFQEHKLIRIRFKPMPGYHFNEEKLRFDKKKVSK